MQSADHARADYVDAEVFDVCLLKCNFHIKIFVVWYFKKRKNLYTFVVLHYNATLTVVFACE